MRGATATRPAAGDKKRVTKERPTRAAAEGGKKKAAAAKPTKVSPATRSKKEATREKPVKVDNRSREPRAVFTISGFEPDGRIKVEFNWNRAFIEKIRELGFEAETEEDCVQLFFFTSAMRPMSLSGKDVPVQPEDHPALGAWKPAT